MNNPRVHFLLHRSWQRTTEDKDASRMYHWQRGDYKRKSDDRTLNYVFTGKLTLFPLFILLLAVGSASLLLFGDKSYFDGYFQSNEVYYGIAGIVLLVVSTTLLIFLLLWLVVKITFTYTPTMFVVTKRGIIRSARLEFKLSQSSLLYFRTHFNDDQSWLQLVVKEGDQYYKIFSLRGKVRLLLSSTPCTQIIILKKNQGNQKERFSKLFRSLQEELYRWQSKYYKNQNIARDSRLNTREIVSKDEFTLVDPFTARLKALTEQRREDQDDTTMLYEYRAIDRMRNRPLCIEDIPVVSYDSFFQHFTHQKSLPHNNKTNNELVGSTQLSINV